MGASKIFQIGLYGLMSLTLSACLPEGKDLPYADQWVFTTERSRRTERRERITPADPKDLCSYEENQNFAVYKFDDLPRPILVEKSAQNDLTTRIRTLQRHMNREFDETEMADVMNIISAGAYNPEDEQDSMITQADLANYDEQRIRQYFR